jgi:hypothetical protein
MNGRYISIAARLRFTLTAGQISSFTQVRAEVHYDDAYVLYLNGTKVGDSGDLTGNPPPFSQGIAVGSEPSMATVDLTGQKSLLVAGTNVLAVQAHNATLSGSSDGFVGLALRGIIEKPSLGGETAARVVINELLANSDAAPGTDWIELYNPGPASMDLSNAYLSDDRLDLLKYKIPVATLQSGKFWAGREGTAQRFARPRFLGDGLCDSVSSGRIRNRPRARCRRWNMERTPFGGSRMVRLPCCPPPPRLARRTPSPSPAIS